MEASKLYAIVKREEAKCHHSSSSTRKLAAEKIMIMHFKSSVKERTFLTIFLLQQIAWDLAYSRCTMTLDDCACHRTAVEGGFLRPLFCSKINKLKNKLNEGERWQ